MADGVRQSKSLSCYAPTPTSIETIIRNKLDEDDEDDEDEANERDNQVTREAIGKGQHSSNTIKTIQPLEFSLIRDFSFKEKTAHQTASADVDANRMIFLNISDEVAIFHRLSGRGLGSRRKREMFNKRQEMYQILPLNFEEPEEVVDTDEEEVEEEEQRGLDAMEFGNVEELVQDLEADLQAEEEAGVQVLNGPSDIGSMGTVVYTHDSDSDDSIMDGSAFLTKPSTAPRGPDADGDLEW
ncbi:hypothetical protein BC830DRAFT_1082415 [Chytriomyces sp. MP71]|nr:hypothetical protein BC830DRAFT_1082415 [Chytriomyces sp. MP71]